MEPLAEIPSKWLESCEVGRFYVLEGSQYPDIRPWVPSDVEAALESWTALTNAIAVRLRPDNENATDFPKWNPKPILQQSQLERVNLHSFAKTFLSRAALPSPRIKFIAPSTSMWTPVSFRADVEGEPPSSGRRQYLTRYSLVTVDGPALLFPALHSPEGPAIRVPLPAPADQDFERRGGLGNSRWIDVQVCVCILT